MYRTGRYQSINSGGGILHVQIHSGRFLDRRPLPGRWMNGILHHSSASGEQSLITGTNPRGADTATYSESQRGQCYVYRNDAVQSGVLCLLRSSLDYAKAATSCNRNQTQSGHASVQRQHSHGRVTYLNCR